MFFITWFCTLTSDKSWINYRTRINYEFYTVKLNELRIENIDIDFYFRFTFW